MQDYGQPGGAYPPQQPPAPPPKKKGGKGLMIIGVILLIVGILIAVVGMMPMMTAKTVDNLEDEDLSDGDRVTISGEITGEEEVPLLNAYMYEIDDKGAIISSEDLGGEGDSILVECEVTLMDFGLGEMKILEAKTILNPMPLVIIGIILLIVGILLMVVGIIKRKKSA